MSKKDLRQGHRVRTAQVHTDLTAFVSPLVQVPFLTDDAWDTLELHFLHKKIQHAWGLPSMVLNSLHAFAPFPAHSEEHTGERRTKRHPWESGKVETMAQNLSFLPPDTKEHLEAHVRSRTAKHRWEIPKQVQESLRGFRAPREASQHGLNYPTLWKGRRAEREGAAFFQQGVFPKEKGPSAAGPKAEMLENGSEGGGAALGEAGAIPREEDEDPSSGASEESPKGHYAGQGPCIKNDVHQVLGVSRGGDVPRSEEGQPKQPRGEGHPPQSVEEAEAKERMAVIGSILERKLRFEDRLERWRQNGGASKCAWGEKHGVFLKERGASAAVLKGEILENGSEAEGPAVGDAGTREPQPFGSSNAREEKDTSGGATEESLQGRSAGKGPCIKNELCQAFEVTKGGENLGSEEGQPKETRGEGHQSQNAEHAQVDELISIIGSVLERKLYLQDGLELWRRDGGIYKYTWRQKQGVSLTEGIPSAAGPKAETLENGSEGEGSAVGEASTTEPPHADHTIPKKQKQTMRSRPSVKSGKEQCAGNVPTIKPGVSQGHRISSRREELGSEEGQPMGHSKGRHPAQPAGGVEGKKRPSFLGRLFGAKVRLFDGLPIWNRERKTEKSTPSLPRPGGAASNSLQASGMQRAGLAGRRDRRRGK